MVETPALNTIDVPDVPDIDLNTLYVPPRVFGLLWGYASPKVLIPAGYGKTVEVMPVWSEMQLKLIPSN